MVDLRGWGREGNCVHVINACNDTVDHSTVKAFGLTELASEGEEYHGGHRVSAIYKKYV